MPYQQDAFGNLVYVPSAGERMRGTHAPPDDLPGDYIPPLIGQRVAMQVQTT